MADTAIFEPALVDLGLGPSEGRGVLVVAIGEGINVLAQLLDGGEGGAVQRLSFENRKPDFDLVQPRGIRRGEVEMDILVTPQPTIDLRLMGAEIVEDDVNGGVASRKAGDNLVHELKEFRHAVDASCGPP